MKKSYKDFIKKYTWWNFGERSCGTKHHILYLKFNHTTGYPIGSIKEYLPDSKYEKHNLHPSPGNHVFILIQKQFSTLDEAMEVAEKDCRRIVMGIIKMYNYYLEEK